MVYMVLKLVLQIGANRCLVTACKRGNMDIICVVLGADTKNFRTKDSIKLIEYTFKTFEYFNIHDFVTNYLSNWNSKNSNLFSIEKGFSNYLEIKIDESFQEISVIPIKKDLIPTIEAKLSMEMNLQAPVNQGDLLGKLNVYSQNTLLAEFDLFSNTTVNKNSMFDYMLNFFKFYPSQLESSVFRINNLQIELMVFHIPFYLIC